MPRLHQLWTSAVFYNWNRVKVRYCDGASFSGNGEDKVITSKKKSSFSFLNACKSCWTVLFRQMIILMVWSCLGRTITIQRAKNMVSCHGRADVHRNAMRWPGQTACFIFLLGQFIVFILFGIVYLIFFSLLFAGATFWLLCWGSCCYTTLWRVQGFIPEISKSEVLRWRCAVPWRVSIYDVIVTWSTHVKLKLLWVEIFVHLWWTQDRHFRRAQSQRLFQWCGRIAGKVEQESTVTLINQVSRFLVPQRMRFSQLNNQYIFLLLKNFLSKAVLFIVTRLLFGMF